MENFLIRSNLKPQTPIAATPSALIIEYYNMRNPGGHSLPRQMDVICLCDYSGSLSNIWLDSINKTLLGACTEVQHITRIFPRVTINFGVIRFATTAEWHIYPCPTDKIKWHPLEQAKGITSLGAAYQLFSTYLQNQPDQLTLIPPTAILFSDGKPTDDAETGLKELMQHPATTDSNFFAVGIGNNHHIATLLEFVKGEDAHIRYANSFNTLYQSTIHSIQQGIFNTLGRHA